MSSIFITVEPPCFSNEKLIRRHVIALSYNSAIVLCEDSLNCNRNQKRGSFVKQKCIDVPCQEN